MIIELTSCYSTAADSWAMDAVQIERGVRLLGRCMAQTWKVDPTSSVGDL